MDINAVYQFLFETPAGVGIMVLACLLITTLACVILEFKTRRVFKDRGPRTDDDEWSFFDDDDDTGK